MSDSKTNMNLEKTDKIKCELILPRDPQNLEKIHNNIVLALDKATKAGAFGLQEAGQLSQDVTVLKYIFTELLKQMQ